jgi:hypothetical protein
MTRRMGPGDVPHIPEIQTTALQPGEDLSALDRGRVRIVPDDGEVSIAEIQERLAMLREQFPEDRIEKLPKPKWKDAWKDQRGSECPVCGGYHVLTNCIHLDYVGHANVTDRLLEVDPFWSWEPMAYTPEGLPLFVKEGLWIRLTICGVTRIGFGDGSSIKEVIGDAIRNAAMRFGVGLDLWAKIDLHAERNRGDGPTSQRQRSDSGVAAPQRGDGHGAGAERQVRADAPDPAPDPAPNQDALDALGAVCDENGIPRNTIRHSFLNWVAKTGRPQGDILFATAEDVEAFTLHLIESMEPPDSEVAAGGVDGGADPDGDGGGSPDPGGEGAADVPDDPGAGPSAGPRSDQPGGDLF